MSQAGSFGGGGGGGAHDLHVAKLIVNSSGVTGTGANYSTISSAMTAASSGDTIFVMPGATGIYTENFTWKAGVNISAFDCDPFTPNVTIIGTVTCTTAGSRSMSGIRLQTNSAAFMAVTGSAATVVNLINCYLNCTNNTGITFSSSSASSQINLYNTYGDLGTTGIGLFANTSAGTMLTVNTRFTNSGGSTTASTASAGGFNCINSRFQFPITLSGTNGSTWEYSTISTTGQNVTSATLNGATHSCKFCRFDSGSASSVSIGSATAQMEFCSVSSTNTNALTGAGALSYSFISFNNTSSGVNVATLTPFATLI